MKGGKAAAPSEPPSGYEFPLAAPSCKSVVELVGEAPGTGEGVGAGARELACRVRICVGVGVTGCR